MGKIEQAIHFGAREKELILMINMCPENVNEDQVIHVLNNVCLKSGASLDLPTVFHLEQIVKSMTIM